MKKKFLGICIHASTILFFGFLSLYAYTLTVSPSPWKSYITIGNSDPVMATDIDSPSKKTHAFYPRVVRIAVENSGVDEMRGCHLVFFNQDMPYELNASFAFTRGDKPTNKILFHFHRTVFLSVQHSAKMLGCAKDDKTGETLFISYGIFFWKMSHSINQEQNWWTFFFNIWYLIILFAILPAIFLTRKLCNRKSISTRKATVEKCNRR